MSHLEALPAVWDPPEGSRRLLLLSEKASQLQQILKGLQQVGGNGAGRDLLTERGQPPAKGREV